MRKVRLDSDIAEPGGRYVAVDLDILVKEIWDPARKADVAIQLHGVNPPALPSPERAATLAESCSAATEPSRRYA